MWRLSWGEVYTGRPKVDANESAAFAYANGKFFWTDATHPVLIDYLQNMNVDPHSAVFGTLYNYGDDFDIPDYEVEMGSDFYGMPSPDLEAESWDKLKQMYPEVTKKPGTAIQIHYDPDRDKFANLEGLPEVATGENPELQQIAQSYMDKAGFPYDPPTNYVKVNPEHAAQIAQQYEEMAHDPNHPEVSASYKALIDETRAQYEHLVDNGYRFEFYPPDHDPYPKGPRQAIQDLNENKHLFVYPTSAGFGTVNEVSDHPLLQDSGIRWKGQPVTYNDLFRAVHDVFGHGKEGVGFRADGEENAWRQHAAMFSDQARPAMTSETRGQNSWVNFGPYGQANQNANQENTIYADQKAGLLPDWVHKTAGMMVDRIPDRYDPIYVNAFLFTGKYGLLRGQGMTHPGLIYSLLRHHNLIDDRTLPQEVDKQILQEQLGGMLAGWIVKTSDGQYWMDTYSDMFDSDQDLVEPALQALRQSYKNIEVWKGEIESPVRSSTWHLGGIYDWSDEDDDDIDWAFEDYSKDFPVGSKVKVINSGVIGTVIEGPLSGQVLHGDNTLWYRIDFNGTIGRIRADQLDWADDLDFHEPDKLPAKHVEQFAQQWPDTLPWSEEEQNYYRTSRIDIWNIQAFIYFEGQLYTGSNHPTILYGILQDENLPTKFRELQDQISNYIDDPNVVFGWLKHWKKEIEIYSDAGAFINRNRDAIPAAVQAIEQKFGPGWKIEDRIDQQDTIESKWLKAGEDGIMESEMNTSSTLMSMMRQDAAASAAFDALSAAGGQVYVVGGAVRDTVLGNTPKDIDLMVTGLTGDQINDTLEQVGRVDLTGKSFGVYRLKRGGDEVEVAMPRTEVSTGNGHQDFDVQTNPSLSVEDDLARRDFTVNAMAFDPAQGQIIDPHAGQLHAKTNQLSLVHDQAFQDDPLRIVRALVAVSKHGLEPDQQLIDQMAEHAPMVRNLPGERIQMEMDKLLAGKNPSDAIRLGFKTGVIDYMAPELSAMQGFDQRNPHHELTVDEHTLAALDKMSKLSNDPDLRLAILFHDSGKPDSFWLDPDAPEGGGGHFYKNKLADGTEVGQDHEDVGAEYVRQYMDRTRYPNKRMDRVEKLVQMHMFPYFHSEKGARKFLAEAGDPKTAWDMLLMREADASGKASREMNDFDTKELTTAKDLLQKVIDDDQAFTIRDLAIKGGDLIAAGVKPGPEMGKILERMLELVIDDPDLNTKDQLLERLPDLATAA